MMQQDPQDRCSEEDTINNHKIIKTLGTGNFAQVKLALHLRTKVPVALKKLEKDKTNSTIIGNELEIMKLLDHPNIIKLFHVLETTEHIYLVLEYASGGDLASHILEVDHIPEVEAQHIFTQLTCAVKYCHENDIAHRDIKPENILMDAMKNVKLCDFGLAVNVSAEPESTVFCGTLPYCAPELFSSQSYDARALDIWSMGVVLYIMVTKHYPFLATTYDQMKIKMQKPHCYIPPKLPVHIASLIIKLLTTDPEQRPKIQDIMQYPWLKGSEEFSKSTLCLEPLPNKPNPRIMAAMLGLGYSLKDIGDSLHENNFNSVMETYLILKYQSPFMDNSNHKENFTLPNIAMAPADPTTCHSFLKNIGSEPDNSTSTVPANYPSQNNKIVKKETKNHSMPSIHCCQQKSQPHSTGVQCGPLKHDHEQILSSSLKKRRRVSKSVSGGPFQHGHGHLLSNRASKSVSCGPVQHNQDKHLLSITLQERGRASKSEFCGPVQHDLEQHLDILSEDHITQVEAQDENPHKSSSFLQHTPSSRSSKEGSEDVTTTDAHQHKSLTPQEISEPNLTSAQPQRVTIASPRRWGGWKQVKRRLVKGLRRLRCCLPAEERRCTFQRRVAPQEGGHNGVT
ncbi:sperm motility kinase X-like [Alexandromys fortis]|uniref:sperm motility kinase X-like n=1 Tax=Alexandromys fortis TaxID=100897 RepID=UPI0021521746|nr:sperm motility kinase X-like [Microtus fortis]